MPRRLLLDVSSLSRWTGPPVGITRVEYALATAARTRPNTHLVIWDKGQNTFRHLNPIWSEPLTGFEAALDTQDPTQSPLSRHRLFAALEKLRLTHPRLAAPIERAQDALLALRPHGHTLRTPNGRRIAHLPPSMALAAPVALTEADTLLSAGSDWFHLDPQALAALKSRHRFRYACLCYDLIPITHPQFYRPEDVARVTRHWHATLPIADQIIVNAACIADDVRRLAATLRLPPPAIAIRPLGVDPPPPNPGPPPAPLTPRRYALFVSTIEPRKGHATLIKTWRALLDTGLPQSADFRLVFVGRPGWMVENILADLQTGIPRLHHLQNVDDHTLAALNANAAFALYPSAYEGFGLPVIEALARNIPVLASTGGALPETIAGAYPCLPPDDAQAWQSAIADWITNPPPPPNRPPLLPWPQAATALLEAAHPQPAPSTNILDIN